MPDVNACRLCGRDIEPRGPGARSYCRLCSARADRLVARPPRMQCRECGGRFAPSGSRIVRYCSDPCRKKSRARLARVRYAARRGAGTTGERDGAAPAKCRVCSRKIAGGGKRQQQRQRQRRHGPALLHCSDACRAEYARTYHREYARRRRADPEQLAVMAARSRAARAGRRVEVHAACKSCGEEFLPASRAYRYCSPCRKRRIAYASSRSLPRPRQAPRRGRGAAPAASTTAKCRACSKEFALAGGIYSTRAYCSNACRAEGRRATVREFNRRLRLGLGKGGRGGGGGRDRRGGEHAVRCRACSKEFVPAGGRGPTRAYCSDACRTEGKRAIGREAMRRYSSDPKKRAIQAAARKGAGRASRRAGAADGGGGGGGKGRRRRRAGL